MVGHDAPNALERNLAWLERNRDNDSRLIGYLVAELNRMRREIEQLLARLKETHDELDYFMAQRMAHNEPRKG